MMNPCLCWDAISGSCSCEGVDLVEGKEVYPEKRRFRNMNKGEKSPKSAPNGHPGEFQKTKKRVI